MHNKPKADKGRHDRSSSMDVSKEMLSPINNSNFINFPQDIKSLNLSKIISPSNLNSNTFISENVPYSSNVSPMKINKNQKSSKYNSQQNSAVQSRRESKVLKLDKLTSLNLNFENNDNDKSVSRAIQITYDLQLEKEREISSKND